MSCFLLARSDEMFTADSPRVRPCTEYTSRVTSNLLTQLENVRSQQADKVEVRFKGHKGDQEQMEACVCGPGTTFTGRGPPLGPTAVPLPLC